jgi:hypothetical protein
MTLLSEILYAFLCSFLWAITIGSFVLGMMS